MFTHKETKILPYAAADIFAIVLDVDCYPEFLPWASNAKTYDRNNGAFLADLSIGYKWVSETYTSEVTFEKHVWVKVEHIKGAFKHLVTYWTFKDLGEQTEITFEITFALKSSLFQSMLESFFEHASQKILGAFEERAKGLSLKKSNVAP